MKTNKQFWSYLAQFFLEWDKFQANAVQKIKTHFKFKNFFFKSCRLWNMYKNIVEPDWPQVTTWRVRIACWIPKETNTHSDYVILIAFPLQQVLHETASVLCCIFVAWRVFVICFFNKSRCPGLRTWASYSGGLEPDRLLRISVLFLGRTFVN